MHIFLQLERQMLRVHKKPQVTQRASSMLLPPGGREDLRQIHKNVRVAPQAIKPSSTTNPSSSVKDNSRRLRKCPSRFPR